MERNCENCYWELNNCKKHCLYYVTTPTKNTCEHHGFICEKCDGNEAEYTYNNKKYCVDCILEEFEVEEETVTNYYLYGEHIGDSNNMDEVIDNLDGVEEMDKEEF